MLSLRILIFWAIAIGAFLLSFLLPHFDVTDAGFVSYSLQVLLFILSLYLIKFEAVRKTRFIFVNFAVFFAVSFLFHLYNFVGTIFFTEDPIMARMMYFQYVSSGVYFFLLAFSICYITLDALFRDFRIIHKYLLALVIVGSLFVYYYHPFLQDARYLYTTENVGYWRDLSKASSSFESQYGVQPTSAQLVTFVQEDQVWGFSRMNDAEVRNIVEVIYPYLAGSNYKILLFQPLYRNTVYMCVFSVGMILLFFGYQYRKDPPQGAYIEKMMFFFLMFCTLEIFHAWSFIKTLEWQSSLRIFETGQYLSALVLAIIAIFFALRLRFITTAYGEFYEHEIVERPAGITRWRDALDNLVLAHFFTRNELVGRFFVSPKSKR